MEVNLDRRSELGINLHGGVPAHDRPRAPCPSSSAPSTRPRRACRRRCRIANLLSMGGFLAGLQGPAIPNLTIGGVADPRLRHRDQRAADLERRERALDAAHPHHRQRGGRDHRRPERALPVGLLHRPLGALGGSRGSPASPAPPRPPGQWPQWPRRPRQHADRADPAAERRSQALGQAADQRERLRAPGHHRADRGDRLAGPGARPHHLQAQRQDDGRGQGPADGRHRRHHAGPGRRERVEDADPGRHSPAGQPLPPAEPSAR